VCAERDLRHGRRLQGRQERFARRGRHRHRTATLRRIRLGGASSRCDRNEAAASPLPARMSLFRKSSIVPPGPLGLFLTAVLNRSPQSAEEDTGPPRGPGTGVSTQSERRSPPRASPRQRGPGQGGGHRPTDPPTAYPGGIRART
jgi:hypothetical protein